MIQSLCFKALFVALFLSIVLDGSSSLAKSTPTEQVPVILDEQAQLNFTLESLLESLITISFTGKIQVDSTKKDPLLALQVYLDSELKAALTYKLNKTKVDEPSSQSKKTDTGKMAQDLLLRIGKPGLRISASAIKDGPDVVTKVRFQEKTKGANGKAKVAEAFIEFFLYSSKMGELVSFRLKGVDFNTSGLFGELGVIDVKGDCQLQQKLFVLDSTPNGEVGLVWRPADCKYEMTYNKNTQKFDYKYTYNSLDPVVSPK